MTRVYPSPQDCPPPPYCDDDDQEEDEPPPPPRREHGGRPKSRGPQAITNFRHYMDTFDEEESGRGGRGDEERPVPAPQKPSMMLTPVDTQPTPTSSGKLCKCDFTGLLIVLVCLVAGAIIALAVLCYIQDSFWNGIVRRSNSFPEMENETFFSGKYLYLYEKEHVKLDISRKHLLRENRWLEDIHIAFFGVFLILAIIQMGSFLTRGKEDHSKIVIVFYVLFGGLGILAALCPMLSLNAQHNFYRMASNSLQDFAKEIEHGSSSESSLISNATASDAKTLASIMMHCSECAEDGLSVSDEDMQPLALFGREYTIQELQAYGFCTLHKYKIINTILSFVFVFLCWIIPFAYYCCSAKKDVENEESKPDEVSTKPSAIVPLAPVKPTSLPQPPQRQHRHSRPPPQAMEKLKGFKAYVEFGSDEDRPQPQLQ